MSAPREQRQGLEPGREGPEARLPPCSPRHGRLCREAWAGIAEKLKLSLRQIDLARCILAGQSEKEIARALGLSRGTVRTHMERLHKKLDIHSRAQLVTRVYGAYYAWRSESPAPIGCHEKKGLASP